MINDMLERINDTFFAEKNNQNHYNVTFVGVCNKQTRPGYLCSSAVHNYDTVLFCSSFCDLDLIAILIKF